MDDLVPIFAAAIAAGTPLVFAALGELVTEKSGVLNLGVEGMMLVGAIAGFAAAVTTGSLWLGALAGMAAGAAMAAIFAVLTLNLMANQVASGLALTLFGIGLSAFVGKPFESVSLLKAGPVDPCGIPPPDLSRCPASWIRSARVEVRSAQSPTRRTRSPGTCRSTATTWRTLAQWTSPGMPVRCN